MSCGSRAWPAPHRAVCDRVRLRPRPAAPARLGGSLERPGSDHPRRLCARVGAPGSCWAIPPAGAAGSIRWWTSMRLRRRPPTRPGRSERRTWFITPQGLQPGVAARTEVDACPTGGACCRPCRGELCKRYRAGQAAPGTLPGSFADDGCVRKPLAWTLLTADNRHYRVPERIAPDPRECPPDAWIDIGPQHDMLRLSQTVTHPARRRC